MLHHIQNNKWILGISFVVLVVIYKSSLTDGTVSSKIQRPQKHELSSELVTASISINSNSANKAIKDENQSISSTFVKNKEEQVNDVTPPTIIKPTALSTDKKDEERELRRSKMDKLRKLANQNNWDEFLKLADDVFLMPEHYRASTITAAIRDKAPKYVFESLLAKGAKFEMPHTFRVVKMDDVRFLKQLITLGLDIHVTTRNGENAINSVVNTIASRKVLNFLLENNVEIKVNKNGTSLLTSSLNRALRNKEAVYYAYKLVQHGVPVSSADFTLVQQIQKENKQSYDLIQRNIPELIRN